MTTEIASSKGGDADEIKGGALVECKERTPRREKRCVKKDGLCGQDVDDVKEVYLKG